MTLFNLITGIHDESSCYINGNKMAVWHHFCFYYESSNGLLKKEVNEMRLDRMTIKVQEALESAAASARTYTHQEIDLEHLLLALLSQQEGLVPGILQKLNVSLAQVTQELEDVLSKKPRVTGTRQEYISARLRDVFDRAESEAAALKDEFISAEHVLLAMAEDQDSSFKKIFTHHGILKKSLLEALKEVRGVHRVTDPSPEQKYQVL